MSVDALIMFFGTIIAILPFLGFPVSWDNIILLIIGSIVVFLGIIVRRRGLVPRARPRKQNAYVESVPQPGRVHERA